VGFDPVSIYLAGLERRFDGIATFCADLLGGPLIGVKWNSQVSLQTSLLLCNCLYHTTPMKMMRNLKRGQLFIPM
jgi:hypothetical protein